MYRAPMLGSTPIPSPTPQQSSVELFCDKVTKRAHLQMALNYNNTKCQYPTDKVNNLYLLHVFCYNMLQVNLSTIQVSRVCVQINRNPSSISHVILIISVVIRASTLLTKCQGIFSIKTTL